MTHTTQTIVTAGSELHLSLPSEFANRQVQVDVAQNPGTSMTTKIYEISDPSMRQVAIETWLNNVIGFISDGTYLRPEQAVLEFIHSFDDDESV